MGVIEGGINLGAPILPATDEDIFPTHDARYGKGGYRSVADIAERDAIPAARREFGMVVHTRDTNINWVWRNNGQADIWQIEPSTVTVASASAMLQLSASRGTIVNRSDVNAVFVLNGDDPTLAANWVELSNNNLDGGSF